MEFKPNIKNTCCSVSQLCPILCDPRDCSTPGIPVHHQLQELTHSCPSSQWCHPTISSSVVSFSSCLQSFPASRSFPVSRPFPSGSQSIGLSASASVLPMNIQGWFPLGLTGLNFWNPRDSQGSSPAPQFERISSSALNLLSGPTLTSIHDYLKNHSFDYMDLCCQSNVSAFKYAIKVGQSFFFPRNKHLLLSWLQSPSAVILEPKKIKSLTVSIVFSSIWTPCHSLSFLKTEF